MATAIITKVNLYSAAQNNLIAFLDNRTLIKEPRSPRGITNRRFVYDFDPFIKLNNFGDFPYIICEFPTIEYSRVTANGKQKMVAWKHNIIMRALKDGTSNSREDLGRSDMLNMMDDIQSLFNTETNKQLFRSLNMFAMNLTTTGTDSVGLSDGRIMYQTTMEISYSVVVDVSA